MSEEKAKSEEGKSGFTLLIDHKLNEWPNRKIKGSEILQLSGSPADYIVNQIVPGPGEDPEIAPTQEVDLAKAADPHGEKQFKTRKPKTNPGC